MNINSFFVHLFQGEEEAFQPTKRTPSQPELPPVKVTTLQCKAGFSLTWIEPDWIGSDRIWFKKSDVSDQTGS